MLPYVATSASAESIKRSSVPEIPDVRDVIVGRRPQGGSPCAWTPTKRRGERRRANRGHQVRKPIDWVIYAVKLLQVPRTRDEHCPPHVHVENEEVPWEARLAFSFIGNAVRLMDVDPIEDAPSTRTIDRIKAGITSNLPRCRAEWWARVSTCCVDNRWIRVSRDGTVTVLARREAGAVCSDWKGDL